MAFLVGALLTLCAWLFARIMRWFRPAHGKIPRRTTALTLRPLLRCMIYVRAMSALNLRGDLARLSDAELAGRLDAAWQAYEAASKPTWWSGSPGWSFRGPIRHPRAYRFLALLQGASGASLLEPLFALVFSSKRYEPWIGSRGPFRSHLSLCEIKDVMDEIERRLNDRNRGTA